MKRSEVPLHRTWDLSCFFKNDQEWQKAYEQLDALCGEYGRFNGRLGDKAALLECYRFGDDVNKRLEYLYGYAHLNYDSDQSNGKYKGMHEKVYSLIVKLNTAGSFFAPQLSAQSEEYIKSCAVDPAFSDYDYSLNEILRRKKYILSEKEEKILAMSGAPLAVFQNTFEAINNVEVPFPKVDDGNGNKVKLSHGLYSVLLSNKDQKIRKGAFEAMYKTFRGLTNTLASNLGGYVKANIFKSSARGYASPRQAALYANNVPEGVYDNLIQSVNANFAPMHKYVALRKKALGLKTLHMYDMYVPIVGNAEIKLDYDSAYSLVLDALAPMGKEYIALLKKAYSERWIDVEETEGKRSGAYVSGIAVPHPFILFNYQKTTHDVFTIAHELGHAMHSYFSVQTQPYAKKDYEIFAAEVASTVNEVLLLKFLIKREQDKDMKKYLLSYYLDMFRTTLFRQTMFAEFERLIHDMEMSGQPITSDALCAKYYELNKKYYGPAVKHDDFIKYEWSRIPHFFYNFYVYQYSTGITSAINIAHRILTEGEKYRDAYIKNFLSAGGHKSPYEILKDAGVDLMTPAPFEVAMKEFGATLNELEKLI